MSARGVALLALCIASCAPHASAQMCAAELERVRPYFSQGGAMSYERAADEARDRLSTGSWFNGTCPMTPFKRQTAGQAIRPGSPLYRQALLEYAECREEFARNPGADVRAGDRPAYVAYESYYACVARDSAARMAGQASPAAQPSASAQASQPARPSPPALPAPSAGVPDPVGEAPEGKLSDTALVARRAVSRQVAVEYRRGNKPKRHIPAAEAHKCLTVSKAGGFNNSCPFAVEFSFCTYRPKKDSWAAFFDCEKGKGGSWQVSANSRTAVHTDAEYVHWFACRYGPKLSQPDGISPADIEYRRDGGPPGRLHGRCAQWGAGG